MRSFEEVKQEMLKKEDKLGQKIDYGILDFVVALNCLGFTTNSSCEGHLRCKGNFFPWVIIMEDNLGVNYNNKEQAEDYYNKNLLQQSKLIQLLADFYQNRTTPFEHRLITGIISGCGTELMPMSGYSTGILKNQEKRKEIYAIYKQEVKEFTKFIFKYLDN